MDLKVPERPAHPNILSSKVALPSFDLHVAMQDQQGRMDLAAACLDHR
jgi:hypothetical protein